MDDERRIEGLNDDTADDGREMTPPPDPADPTEPADPDPMDALDPEGVMEGAPGEPAEPTPEEKVQAKLDELEEEVKEATTKLKTKVRQVEAELNLDGDDYAILSMIGGIAALALSMWGFASWLLYLSPVLASLAVMSGYKAVTKLDTRYEKQAFAGIVCGTIGLCFFLIISSIKLLSMVFGG